MRYTLVEIVRDQIEEIFLEVRTCTRNDLDLVLTDHLREAQSQFRRRHRTGERDHHLPAFVEMLNIAFRCVDQCRSIEMSIMMLDEFSYLSVHVANMIGKCSGYNQSRPA